MTSQVSSTPALVPAGRPVGYAFDLRRRVSVRRSVQLVLAALLLLAGTLLILNQRALTKSAFLLRRAETSYRQLDIYRQLSIDTLEYAVADPSSAVARRRDIEDELRALDRLETFEVDLVEENGGEDNNAGERHRLGRIRTVIQDLLTQNGAASALVYRSQLKPLFEDAMSGEKAETAAVESSMRDMQIAMQWLGWLGIVAQATMVALVLAVVERAVLAPLRRLVQDIREFGRGRLAHRVAARWHDEFGLLAQHINRMARQLDHRTQDLVAINDALEATVAARTRALAERNDELQEVDASRRRFFADVSHELRTPLTAIVGEADVTLRDPRSDLPACQDALASILANSTFLNRRIDDLMALARSPSGRLDLDLGRVDLNLIAMDAVAEVRSLARVNQVSIQFEPTSRPIEVIGDRLRLRQCLTILLDNAVKFSPAYRMVQVDLHALDDTAELSVADEGRGIDAAELPMIFERFYQSDVGRRMGGSGLGLAIARRILEAHDGTIRAARAEGGGAVMTLRIPISEGETE